MVEKNVPERDWCYLLPDRKTTAVNMKIGRQILSEQTGNHYSPETFRNLVRKGVIIKINIDTNSILSQSDADKKTHPTR